ncbi:tail sheath [Pseudomonas phage PhiPA3]|uniref:Tail sheath protein n=1 Tax=Pseudomonas phage PhiPA3 TaxID=998086 RepID=F8SK38_BPPA3|nr:tail sheath [Pseudomonas phage PhiPA3]AEH03588.1 tail sheath protein [Pseudomonas phage PhiPA3]
MAANPNPGMISQMPSLNIVTGEEFLEVIKRETDGSYKNYRLMVSKIRTNEGLSAYEVAVKNGFVGTEQEWLDSLQGKSIYQLALEHGFVGSEQEYLDSLKGEAGKSAYQTAVDEGYTGTEAQWLQTLVGQSAYDIAVEQGFVGDKDAWLASLKGEKGDKGDDADLTAEKLQELLNLHGYTIEQSLRVLGDNSGVIANAGFFNFLFLFDKRLNNRANDDVDKVPQRMVEMGRMEAEGYSYWKNEPASTDDPSGPLPAVPDSELRLFDDGKFQIGSLNDYIEFGDGSKVSIVVGGSAVTYDLAEATQGKDGKSAYEIAVEHGYTGTEQEWLTSLRGPAGASAYDVAVEQGYTGTETEWVASLQGTDGKSAYESAVDGGFTGTEEEFNTSLAQPKGKSGGVFITDITPQSVSENVGNKVMSADGFSLVSASSTTKAVTVAVTAITGHTNYRPVVKVNGVTVTLTAKADAPLWTGTANITLADPAEGETNVVITAEHEDGASATSTVAMDTPAVVLTGVFTGNYPGTQTELKAGDTMSIAITTDQPVVAYEIENSGAFAAKSGTLTSGTTHTITGVAIADRGNTAAMHGFRVRVRKASGSWSNWFDSSTVGSTEKTHVVKLNNLKPTVTIGAVTYPAGQGAIKGGESAQVANTLANFDTVSYTSGNGQLTVANPTQSEANKVVTYLAGTYNDSTNNFTITANRAANGSSTTASTVVKIANVDVAATITYAAPRLRSGGNNGTVAQQHTITLTATQALTDPPSMNVPSGTWETAAWQPDAARKVWTRKLIVHDNDSKGQFDYNNVVLKGLSGRVVSTLAGGGTYVIGGFVFRTLTVPAYPNRSTEIGTVVADTSKLRCSNLSKGASGSLNFTYQAATTDAVDRYSITGGDTWYNCDAANAVSNTSGLMQIELEEVV